jgi:DNA repair protein RadC
MINQVRERAETYGNKSLSDAELISLAFGISIDAGRKALFENQTLEGVLNSVSTIEGVGKAKSAQAKAIIEIVGRIQARNNAVNPILNEPEKIYDFMREFTKNLEVEKFWILCLNKKNRLIKMIEFSSGTVDSCLANPRDILREVLRQGACHFICSHFHPSGDPAPSAADIRITRSITEASKTVGLEFLDHVIIGDEKFDPRGLGYYSFQASGRC